MSHSGTDQTVSFILKNAHTKGTDIRFNMLSSSPLSQKKKSLASHLSPSAPMAPLPTQLPFHSVACFISPRLSPLLFIHSVLFLSCFSFSLLLTASLFDLLLFVRDVGSPWWANSPTLLGKFLYQAVWSTWVNERPWNILPAFCIQFLVFLLVSWNGHGGNSPGIGEEGVCSEAKRSWADPDPCSAISITK